MWWVKCTGGASPSDSHDDGVHLPHPESWFGYLVTYYKHECPINSNPCKWPSRKKIGLDFSHKQATQTTVVQCKETPEGIHAIRYSVLSGGDTLSHLPHKLKKHFRFSCTYVSKFKIHFCPIKYIYKSHECQSWLLLSQEEGTSSFTTIEKNINLGLMLQLLFVSYFSVCSISSLLFLCAVHYLCFQEDQLLLMILGCLKL